jgi:hypothetical protein
MAKCLTMPENPLRKKLATDLDDWRCQGRIHDLR